MDEHGWTWMNLDKNWKWKWKWIKVDEIDENGWCEWKWIKVDEMEKHGWKLMRWMKMYDGEWKWVKPILAMPRFRKRLLWQLLPNWTLLGFSNVFQPAAEKITANLAKPCLHETTKTSTTTSVCVCLFYIRVFTLKWPNSYEWSCDDL